MKLNQVFNVFSKRTQEAVPLIQDTSITLRTKILIYCQDVFNNSLSFHDNGDFTNEFWNEIHHTFQYRHGKTQLTDGYLKSRKQDIMEFLRTCEDENFFDFIEYIFRVKCLFNIGLDENEIVAGINELFASENIGYALTEMIKEEVIEPVDIYPFSGGDRKVIKTVSYPQVIKKDDQVIHAITIKPVLSLLSDPKYKTANQEFLEALEDYRKGDYGDCLTKCGSAFESVMKIICDTNKWSYKQTDNASTLIKIIVKKLGLESFFEQPLMIIATLRNKLSTAHGAGVSLKKVSPNYARYALNSTAAAIKFLVDETKLS